MQLKDKIIIVTGGGQGLGRAMAEHLAAKGARLALVDLNEERLAAAVTACKAGVASATVVWAKELARYGIRVAGVAPGFIETEMVASMKPEALEKMTAGIPLRRMGKPEEIAHSVAYIFENDYYTGRILELDGGLRL